jgi:hypothetical protein
MTLGNGHQFLTRNSVGQGFLTSDIRADPFEVRIKSSLQVMKAICCPLLIDLRVPFMAELSTELP